MHALLPTSGLLLLVPLQKHSKGISLHFMYERMSLETTLASCSPEGLSSSILSVHVERPMVSFQEPGVGGPFSTGGETRSIQFVTCLLPLTHHENISPEVTAVPQAWEGGALGVSTAMQASYGLRECSFFLSDEILKIRTTGDSVLLRWVSDPSG